MVKVIWKSDYFKSFDSIEDLKRFIGCSDDDWNNINNHLLKYGIKRLIIE